MTAGGIAEVRRAADAEWAVIERDPEEFQTWLDLHDSRSRRSKAQRLRGDGVQGRGQEDGQDFMGLW